MNLTNIAMKVFKHPTNINKKTNFQYTIKYIFND